MAETSGPIQTQRLKRTYRTFKTLARTLQKTTWQHDWFQIQHDARSGRFKQIQAGSSRLSRFKPTSRAIATFSTLNPHDVTDTCGTRGKHVTLWKHLETSGNCTRFSSGSHIVTLSSHRVVTTSPSRRVVESSLTPFLGANHRQIEAAPGTGPRWRRAKDGQRAQCFFRFPRYSKIFQVAASISQKFN